MVITSYFVIKYQQSLLKGDSRLASSHLEIFVSLFQPATVVSKKIHQTADVSVAVLQPSSGHISR